MNPLGPKSKDENSLPSIPGRSTGDRVDHAKRHVPPPPPPPLPKTDAQKKAAGVAKKTDAFYPKREEVPRELHGRGVSGKDLGKQFNRIITLINKAIHNPKATNQDIADLTRYKDALTERFTAQLTGRRSSKINQRLRELQPIYNEIIKRIFSPSIQSPVRPLKKKPTPSSESSVQQPPATPLAPPPRTVVSSRPPVPPKPVLPSIPDRAVPRNPPLASVVQSHGPLPARGRANAITGVRDRAGAQTVLPPLAEADAPLIAREVQAEPPTRLAARTERARRIGANMQAMEANKALVSSLAANVQRLGVESQNLLANINAMKSQKDGGSKEKLEGLRIKLNRTLIELHQNSNRLETVSPGHHDSTAMRQLIALSLLQNRPDELILKKEEERWIEFQTTGKLSGMKPDKALRKVAGILARKLAEYLLGTIVISSAPEGVTLPPIFYRHDALKDEINNVVRKLNTTKLAEGTWFKAIKELITKEGMNIGENLKYLIELMGWMDDDTVLAKTNLLHNASLALVMKEQKAVDKLDVLIEKKLVENNIDKAAFQRAVVYSQAQALAKKEMDLLEQTERGILNSILQSGIETTESNLKNLTKDIYKEIDRLIRGKFAGKDLDDPSVKSAFMHNLKVFLEGGKLDVNSTPMISVFQTTSISPKMTIPSVEVLAQLSKGLLGIAKTRQTQILNAQQARKDMCETLIPPAHPAKDKLIRELVPLVGGIVEAMAKIPGYLKGAAEMQSDLNFDSSVNSKDVREKHTQTLAFAKELATTSNRRKWAQDYDLFTLSMRTQSDRVTVISTVGRVFNELWGELCPFRSPDHSPDEMLAFYETLSSIKNPENSQPYKKIKTAIQDIDKAFKAASPVLKPYYDNTGKPTGIPLTEAGKIAFAALHGKLNAIYEVINPNVLKWNKLKPASEEDWANVAALSQDTLIKTMSKAFRVIEEVNPALRNPLKEVR